MKLMLHGPGGQTGLTTNYRTAFAEAVEIFVVSAYLTDWDVDLKLNPACRRLRIIIGKDFGITRKEACRKVLAWLPKGKRPTCFKVVDQAGGFHPKAVFWKDARGDHYAIVGSSNLTRAAFDGNYEANVFCKMSAADYADVRLWVRQVEAASVPVSEDWLEWYQEVRRSPGAESDKSSSRRDAKAVSMRLPRPPDMRDRIKDRQERLAAHQAHRSGLMNLFRDCAAGRVSSAEFYRRLPEHWSDANGNRLQGSGFERQGKGSDFEELARSFLAIEDAAADERDDVVVEEIDHLHERGVSTRGAFLSEMLCLRFPDLYPVLNKPVWAYLDDGNVRLTWVGRGFPTLAIFKRQGRPRISIPRAP